MITACMLMGGSASQREGPPKSNFSESHGAAATNRMKSRGIVERMIRVSTEVFISVLTTDTHLR